MEESAVLAFAFMRRLYQTYDAGGHSARSQRSRLVESVLVNVHPDVFRCAPDVIPHHGLLGEARQRATRQTHQRNFPFAMPYVGLEEYACVVLLTIQALCAHMNEEVSLIERVLVKGALVLLHAKDDMPRYLHLVHTHDVEEIIAEGRARKYERVPTHEYLS